MGDLFFRQSAAFWAKITSNGQHRLPLLTIFSRDFSWVTHTDVFIRCWTFIFKQSYMRDWTSLAEIVPNVRCMQFFPQKRHALKAISLTTIAEISFLLIVLRHWLSEPLSKQWKLIYCTRSGPYRLKCNHSDCYKNQPFFYAYFLFEFQFWDNHQV